MKVSMFHLMPHRDLPADFEDRYHSVRVDIPWSDRSKSAVLQLDPGRAGVR